MLAVGVAIQLLNLPHAEQRPGARRGLFERTLPSMVLETYFNPHVGMAVLTTGAHLRR